MTLWTCMQQQISSNTIWRYSSVYSPLPNWTQIARSSLLFLSLPVQYLKVERFWKLFQPYLISGSSLSFLNYTCHWEAVSSVLPLLCSRSALLRAALKVGPTRCWVFPERHHSTESFWSCSSNSFLESTIAVICSMSCFTRSLPILVLAMWMQIFFCGNALQYVAYYSI